MTFPRYPTYADSGVDWVGSLPVGWAVLPIKRLLSLQTNRANARSFAVALENIEGWSGRFIDSEASYEGEGTAFKEGDILFGKLRPYLAKVWLADRAGEAVGDFHVLRCGKPHFANFVQRLLLTREIISLIDGSTYGAKMPRASWEFIGSLQVPVPAPAEQVAICDFLDRETAKIDALVAEQERLIALLKEKRQAVITQAVTKGLNPEAPMKPSGIEWLGEVPAHWEIVPLRWVSTCQSGAAAPFEAAKDQDADQNQVPMIGGNGIMGYCASSNIAQNVIAIGRVGALCGNVHVVSPPAWITDNALVLRADPKAFDINYLAHSLRSRGLNDIASKTAQPLITGAQVSGQRLPRPPISEQLDIGRFIDSTVSEFDRLSIEVERAVALLRERRAALISAAVTGKIDVRDLASTAPKQAAAA